jgi:two-component system, OmpR family, sensor histidine kinase MtrB
MCPRSLEGVCRWAKGRSPIPLRLRAIIAFAAVSLVLAGTLSIVTYFLVRTRIINDRQNAAVRQTYTEARLVRSRLLSGETDFSSLLSGLQTTGTGSALMERGGHWYASSVGVGPSQIPTSLEAVVSQDHAGWETIATTQGPVLFVGVPIAQLSARFYVLEPLNDLSQTLTVLGTALAVGAGIAALVGAVTGTIVSRRIMQPLQSISAVAQDISAGSHEARLLASDDPDLKALVVAFNHMVDELEERARREARFAADVSHDLRGPLATFSAAVNVVNRRRQTLPPEALVAMDALEEQLESFNKLVVDLLEISRFEAGTATLETSVVDAATFVRGVVAERGDRIPVECLPGYEPQIDIDPRRMRRVFGNLIENASRYAGGVTRVVIEPGADGFVAIAFQDDGPGVPLELREAIFTRYERGRAQHDSTMPKGSGLGLALAAQHTKLHGGSIRVEDAPGGGARFVIELPKVM